MSILSRVPFTKLIFALSLGLGACGGSSDGGAFDDFVGTWRFDKTSSLNLSCAGSNIPNITLWNDLVFAPGTVTDLIETTSQCQFGYNVSGKTATLASPDPLTGLAPTCSLGGTFQDPQLGEIKEDVTVVPAAAQWTFTLAAAVKGQAPHASLNGAAQWTEVLTPAGQMAETIPCTYAVAATLTKIAKD